MAKRVLRERTRIRAESSRGRSDRVGPVDGLVNRKCGMTFDRRSRGGYVVAEFVHSQGSPMARDRYDDDRDDDDDNRGRGRRRDDDDDREDDYDDRPRGSAPPNYLGFSIFVLLCCCWIGGIVAVIHAAQVNSKWAGGDYAGARQASATAKTWCWVSFCIGLVVQPLVFAAQIMAEQKNIGN